jgi:hypothetical protein
MFRKEFSRTGQKEMNAAAYVEQAREMAAALEDRESLVARSRPRARQSVARAAGVSASLLHSLRYRPPKQIAADVFERLCAAVERQALHQIRTAQHEIATVRARRLGVDDRAICAAEAALEQARGFLKGE